MPSSEYEQLLQWLYALEARRGIDFKLERIELALAELGDPHRRYPVVHIAGTNGKGSVAAMVDAALRAAGRRTGLYTSPHLVRFSERIRVAAQEIPPEDVVRLARDVHRSSTIRGIELTFFEFTTVLAFLYFATQQIEIAVVEVGLGGRLDATNVVHPEVSVITTIGLDHQEFLGDTVESIAAEKAGIIKEGCSVVVGNVEPEAAQVIARIAAQRGAKVSWLGRDFLWQGDERCWVYSDAAGELEIQRLGLAGLHQCDNAAVAARALRALSREIRPSDEAVRRGLQEVVWPGRFEVYPGSPTLVLDGAHNVQGITVLVQELQRWFGGRRVHLVFSVMADKDWRAMIRLLAPLCASVTLTRARPRRAASLGDMVSLWGATVPVHIVEQPVSALHWALENAGPQDLVVVTGSLFLVGEVQPVVASARRSQFPERLLGRGRVAD